MDSEDESTFDQLSEISPCQEQIFQNCSFTLERDYLSGNVDEDSAGEYESTVPMHGTPVQSTGIIMISLPTTPINETISQQDQFQTPPEGHYLTDGDCSVNGEEMYKDCDLGFSQSQTASENLGEIDVRAPGIVGGETLSAEDLGGEKLSVDADCLEGGETLSVDDDCRDGEKMADLNNDCNISQTKDTIADLVDCGETLAFEDDRLQGDKLVDLDTDCNPGQTKDPIADLVDGDQTLSIDDHCLGGEKMVDLDKDTEDQPLSKYQLVATTGVAHDSDCENMVRLDKDTEDQALSDIQIIEQPTPVVDCDTEETVALPDCEKAVDLGKDSDPGSSIGKLSVRMSAMELQEIVGEKNVESQLEKEGIIGIVENSLSQGVDLVSDNALTEAVEPEFQQITGDKNVELQESSNGKDDETEESEKSIIRIAEDPLSEGVDLVSDNGPAEPIESDNASSSGVNRDKRKKKKNKKKKKTSEISNDLPKKGRELPASIIRGVDNVKEAETPTDFLMNLLKSLAKKSAPKKDDDNVGDNLVVTAMKRGVTFPRPSSWPPGYRPSWFPEGCDCVE